LVYDTHGPLRSFSPTAEYILPLLTPSKTLSFPLLSCHLSIWIAIPSLLC